MIKRIIARLDIKNNFLVKGMHLEGLRILGYPEFFAEKYFEENILMNTLIIREAFKNNVSSLIGILSSCIYPNEIDEYPINETKLFEGAPHQDLFSYAYAKRCMAIQIEAYNSKYGTHYNYLIPCNLYGEYDKFGEIEGHFVGALVQKICSAKKNNQKLM